MASLALLTLSSCLSRVRDLGAGYWADVYALAIWLVDLETRRTLLVEPPRQVLDPVARVGADVDGLPDDVVGRVAMLAYPQWTLQDHTRLGTVKR